jgi:hypothetical protein
VDLHLMGSASSRCCAWEAGESEWGKYTLDGVTDPAVLPFLVEDGQETLRLRVAAGLWPARRSCLAVTEDARRIPHLVHGRSSGSHGRIGPIAARLAT